jgi:hypothetical protein
MKKNLKKPAISYYSIMASIILILILIISSFQAYGQKDTTEVKKHKPKSEKIKFPLFSRDELLNVNLYLDIAKFLKKTSKTDSFDAQMTFNPGTSDSVNMKVVVKYRGILRYDICSFPPIEINFDDPVHDDSLKIKKLKLVTHCEPGSVTDEYIIREYLVYKLFNALTDTCLRTRLLKVNYIDINGKKKTVSKYGFFIEPVSMLAKRTNSEIIKSKNLKQQSIVPAMMDRLAIFNYMVSNWDWSLPGQHNVKVIKPVKLFAGGLGIAVPYDFDITGVVNASYASPPPEFIGTENIRERRFYGLCRTKEVYVQDLKEFSDKKEKIYMVINDCQYLTPRSKKDITNFLDGFFDQLENEKTIDKLINEFLKTCKN